MVDFIQRTPEIYDGAGLASPTDAVVKRVKEPKININKFDTSSLDVEKFEPSVSDVPEVSSVAVERISDLEIMLNDQGTERDIKNQYNDMLVVIGTTNQEKPINFNISILVFIIYISRVFLKCPERGLEYSVLNKN